MEQYTNFIYFIQYASPKRKPCMIPGHVAKTLQKKTSLMY